jgi:hypothetical protein
MTLEYKYVYDFLMKYISVGDYSRHIVFNPSLPARLNSKNKHTL